MALLGLERGARPQAVLVEVHDLSSGCQGGDQVPGSRKYKVQNQTKMLRSFCIDRYKLFSVPEAADWALLRCPQVSSSLSDSCAAPPRLLRFFVIICMMLKVRQCASSSGAPKPACVRNMPQLQLLLAAQG